MLLHCFSSLEYVRLATVHCYGIMMSIKIITLSRMVQKEIVIHCYSTDILQNVDGRLLLSLIYLHRRSFKCRYHPVYVNIIDSYEDMFMYIYIYM